MNKNIYLIGNQTMKNSFETLYNYVVSIFAVDK